MASIFSDEWRDCLRAHYTHIVRNGDHGTEKTLRGVMHEVGFGEDELRQLYVMATAHVDAVGADFVPDMDIFDATDAAEPAPVMVAVAMLEAAAPADEPMVVEDVIELVDESVLEAEAEVDAEAEAADAEVDDAVEAVDEDDAPPDDPDVTQLSLF